MTDRYVLGLDQGTTGNTAIVIDPEGVVVGRATNEFPQIYPQAGWVEHDPESIWSGMLSTVRAALNDASIQGNAIGAIGITNQRETTVLWERDTGAPLHNAIVWQDRRTSSRCEELRQAGHSDAVQVKTGLVIDPYFSGTKIEWLLNKLDKDRKQAASGRWCVGTIDTYLLYKLTGGNVFATEPSNASRTLLYGIDEGKWDTDLLELFGVPEALLPEVKPSSGIFGETHGLEDLPDGIPIAGIAGDQQAALFGQACFEPGQSKCTYGTGAFLLLNTGPDRIDSSHGILTTVGWKIGEDPQVYALEGSAFIAGAAVQWLRDGLELINEAPEIERLASKVEDSDGVVFVPALSGLGAPHWNAEARGTIHGITRGTTKAHLARATLDGIAFQIADLVEAMNADARTPIHELRVDGGAAANNLLMQIQSDIAQVPIIRPANLETTAWGAGFLAGLATDIWPSRTAIQDAWREDQRFEPQISDAEAQQKREHWQSIVSKA